MRDQHTKPIIRNFIAELRQAVLGEEKNYTSGSINKAIFMLSVPMILEMIMESMFAVVDVFFVGRLGVDAIATVGLTESIVMVIYAVSVGLSMGVTAMVARRVGEGHHEEASAVVYQGILASVLLSLVFGMAGMIYAEELLALMGASEQLIATGSMYTRILLGGNLTITLLFVLNAMFRGAGDAAIAMRVLWLSNGLNIILDPLFIFGLGPIEGMGVAGAAVATTIGRGIGVLYQFFILIRGRALVRLARRHLIYKREVMARLIRVSLGGIGQYLIGTASWIFLVRIISHFGSEAVAGYTISFRIIIFTILPSWGIANAAATLVGQNLGAGKADRAEQSVWRCAWYNMIFLFILSILFILIAEDLVRIFTGETEVVAHGVTALRFICAGYIFYAYGMVVSQAFNGAGDTRTPTFINFLSYWLVQIPLAYVLAVRTSLEISGVYLAILISELLLAVMAILIFRKGKWKLIKL